jgi:hypothetical protein
VDRLPDVAEREQECEASSWLGCVLAQLWGMAIRHPGLSARATRRAPGLRGEASVCQIVVQLQRDRPARCVSIVLDAGGGFLHAHREGPVEAQVGEWSRELKADLVDGYGFEGRRYATDSQLADAVVRLAETELRLLRGSSPAA